MCKDKRKAQAKNEKIYLRFTKICLTHCKSVYIMRKSLICNKCIHSCNAKINESFVYIVIMSLSWLAQNM